MSIEFEPFMQKYGNMFSGNPNIGRYIVDQLDRHGFDTSSAMMDAVQSICNQLRGEATTLLDAINLNQTQASQIIDKIDKIDQSVQAAAQATGMPIDTSVLEPPPPGPTDAMMGAPAGAVMPDQSLIPPNEEEAAAVSSEVPPEAAAAAPPAAVPKAAAAPAVPSPEAAAPAALPPEGPQNWEVLSDVHEKSVKKDVSSGYRKRSQREKSDKDANKTRPSGLFASIARAGCC